MRVEHINPFIQGTEGILKTVCGVSTSLGKIYKKPQIAVGEYSILIEIVGELKGVVFYSMNENTACKIASKMMSGMPISALDDMSKSALCELSNMISGNVATIFSGMNISVDIKPPIFNDGKTPSQAYEFITIPINIDDSGILEINVFFG